MERYILKINENVVERCIINIVEINILKVIDSQEYYYESITFHNIFFY